MIKNAYFIQVKLNSYVTLKCCFLIHYMTYHGSISIELQSDLKNLKPLYFLSSLNGSNFKIIIRILNHIYETS